MLILGAGEARVGSCDESKMAHGQQGPEATTRNACFQGKFEEQGRNYFVEGEQATSDGPDDFRCVLAGLCQSEKCSGCGDDLARHEQRCCHAN